MAATMFESRGVTLIEILSILAMIAVLAAIAIPNYNTAQTRARVARTISGIASMRTAIESYRVDHATTPETDWAAAIHERGAGLHRLTTPVAYLSSVPRSGFAERHLGRPNQPRHARGESSVLYVRGQVCGARLPAEEPDLNLNAVDDAYEFDRMVYLFGAPGVGGTPVGQRGYSADDLVRGVWMMKSVGPNGVDDREAGQGPFSGAHARVYNPANGTMSHGDIVVFGDSPEARRR